MPVFGSYLSDDDDLDVDDRGQNTHVAMANITQAKAPYELHLLGCAG